MTILDEIIELKRPRVEAAKSVTPIGEMRRRAAEVRQSAVPNRLAAALGRDAVNVIAEIKRASPSKGVINGDIDVAATAAAYERGGAAAISVLTEEDRFLGSLADLSAARAAAGIAILRKDFVFDGYQIFEAAVAGADAILLIAAMLGDSQMAELYDIADRELGLDALVEVHTADELERAAKLEPKLIGVNNRDLKSFAVSLDVSRDLIGKRPPNSLMVAESGLSSRTEIEELRALGFNGFLIGESLMRSPDAMAMLESWR